MTTNKARWKWNSETERVAGPMRMDRSTVHLREPVQMEKGERYSIGWVPLEIGASEVAIYKHHAGIKERGLQKLNRVKRQVRRRIIRY